MGGAKVGGARKRWCKEPGAGPELNPNSLRVKGGRTGGGAERGCGEAEWMGRAE